MMRGTAGATAEDQRFVIELTNIAFCDIVVSFNWRDGLVGHDILPWLFCAENSEEQPGNEVISLFLRSPNHRRTRISAEDELSMAVNSLQKQPAPAELHPMSETGKRGQVGRR
jgi:hypothetical protein